MGELDGELVCGIFRNQIRLQEWFHGMNQCIMRNTRDCWKGTGFRFWLGLKFIAFGARGCLT